MLINALHELKNLFLSLDVRKPIGDPQFKIKVLKIR